MTLVGLLFGAVGARCDLSAGASVTRVLVLSRRAAARAPPLRPAPDAAWDDRPSLDPATVPVARFARRATGPA
jgi:hypothetical protein